MTISIDASRLTTTNKPTGVELYCREIIGGLVNLNKDIILYTPKIIEILPKKGQRILPWPFKIFWSQIRLGLELLIFPPDLFFTPGYVIPFLALLNTKLKKVSMIHDVAFKKIPKSYSIPSRLFLNLTTKLAVKHCHKIITPTKAVKDDLVKIFKCPAEKISVTHLGFIVSKKSILKGNAIKKKNQILFIGRIEKKKNIGKLIEAFKIFYERHPDWKLILVGKPGEGFESYKVQIEDNDFIDYLGYIDEMAKEKFLNESKAFAFLSIEEGFGFPILESFAHGLPVVASDIPVLQEIGGNAVQYVDPYSATSIASGMQKVTHDIDYQDELISRGSERLKQFNWDSCVRKTLETLTI